MQWHNFLKERHREGKHAEFYRCWWWVFKFGESCFVKSSFQLNLTNDHLKTNVLVRCSNSKANIDDSVKTPALYISITFFLLRLWHSYMWAVTFTYITCWSLVCVYSLYCVEHILMRPALVFLSVSGPLLSKWVNPALDNCPSWTSTKYGLFVYPWNVQYGNWAKLLLIGE